MNIFIQFIIIFTFITFINYMFSQYLSGIYKYIFIKNEKIFEKSNKKYFISFFE